MYLGTNVSLVFSVQFLTENEALGVMEIGTHDGEFSFLELRIFSSWIVKGLSEVLEKKGT